MNEFKQKIVLSVTDAKESFKTQSKKLMKKVHSLIDANELISKTISEAEGILENITVENITDEAKEQIQQLKTMVENMKEIREDIKAQVEFLNQRIEITSTSLVENLEQPTEELKEKVAKIYADNVQINAQAKTKELFEELRKMSTVVKKLSEAHSKGFVIPSKGFLKSVISQGKKFTRVIEDRTKKIVFQRLSNIFLLKQQSKVIKQEATQITRELELFSLKAEKEDIEESTLKDDQLVALQQQSLETIKILEEIDKLIAITQDIIKDKSSTDIETEQNELNNFSKIEINRLLKLASNLVSTKEMINKYSVEIRNQVDLLSNSEKPKVNYIVFFVKGKSKLSTLNHQVHELNKGLDQLASGELTDLDTENLSVKKLRVILGSKLTLAKHLVKGSSGLLLTVGKSSLLRKDFLHTQIESSKAQALFLKEFIKSGKALGIAEVQLEKLKLQIQKLEFYSTIVETTKSEAAKLEQIIHSWPAADSALKISRAKIDTVKQQIHLLSDQFINRAKDRTKKLREQADKIDGIEALLNQASTWSEKLKTKAKALSEQELTEETIKQLASLDEISKIISTVKPVISAKAKELKEKARTTEDFLKNKINEIQNDEVKETLSHILVHLEDLGENDDIITKIGSKLSSLYDNLEQIALGQESGYILQTKTQIEKSVKAKSSVLLEAFKTKFHQSLFFRSETFKKTSSYIVDLKNPISALSKGLLSNTKEKVSAWKTKLSETDIKTLPTLLKERVQHIKKEQLNLKASIELLQHIKESTTQFIIQAKELLLSPGHLTEEAAEQLRLQLELAHQMNEQANALSEELNQPLNSYTVQVSQLEQLLESDHTDIEKVHENAATILAQTDDSLQELSKHIKTKLKETIGDLEEAIILPPVAIDDSVFEIFSDIDFAQISSQVNPIQTETQSPENENK